MYLFKYLNTVKAYRQLTVAESITLWSVWVVTILAANRIQNQCVLGSTVNLSQADLFSLLIHVLRVTAINLEKSFNADWKYLFWKKHEKSKDLLTYLIKCKSETAPRILLCCDRTYFTSHFHNL